MVNVAEIIDLAEITTFKIEAGETLQLKGVGARILHELIEEMGGFEDLGKKTGEKENLAATRLFMYVAGFGIASDLPEYALEELELFGIEKTKSERILKAHWAKMILTNSERSELISRVFMLSME